MKIPYLNSYISSLIALKENNDITYTQKQVLKEYQTIKQALEPKMTKKEVETYLFNNCPVSIDDDIESIFILLEKLGIKFKEPEIELVEGEWYFVKPNNSNWWYLKYETNLDWTNYEIRTKDNPPK